MPILPHLGGWGVKDGEMGRWGDGEKFLYKLKNNITFT
jgi:hypothetical protein